MRLEEIKRVDESTVTPFQSLEGLNKNGIEEESKDFEKLITFKGRPTGKSLSGARPFSPKLIPIQKRPSFSSSERSSDLENFLAKN